MATLRERLWLSQAARCAVCKQHCLKVEAVADHDHSTGSMRGVLHRSCNALLGRIENNFRRYGVKNLAAFCSGLTPYLQHHAFNRTGLLHPSHRTDEERRLRRNAQARKARATRKAQ